MTKPLQGQISLFDTIDLDDAENVPGACYQARSGIVADDAGALWRGYSPGTSDDEVRSLFRSRFGCDPQVIRRGPGGLVFAGPIP